MHFILINVVDERIVCLFCSSLSISVASGYAGKGPELRELGWLYSACPKWLINAYGHIERYCQ